ncbi:testis-expressed protein 50 isoform X2 [Papio anubis]|uniref:testis-expressed protein 50 isoform X2 n=1 Tax=Papio anubis TaxID=9555 RepID=UPI0012AE91DD|nr:testis-expressed protein 50 isoform X2 [Papio anubis]
MSNQGLPLSFSLLLICFFGESFCICDGTIWTKVGWEILPEEVHYWKFKGSPSHRLPYLLDKLCCDFANMDIFQGCLYLIYNLLQALFFILFVLSVHYLWMKWKKHQKKVKGLLAPATTRISRTPAPTRGPPSHQRVEGRKTRAQLGRPLSGAVNHRDCRPHS